MQEITQGYEVKKGDVLELHYNILSFWTNDQIDSLCEKIEASGKMSVQDYSIEKQSAWMNDPDYGWTPRDKLILKVEVIENPFPVLILVALIAGTAGLIFLSISLDKIYLIAKETPQALSTVGLGLFTILVIAGMIFYFVVKR